MDSSPPLKPDSRDGSPPIHLARPDLINKVKHSNVLLECGQTVCVCVCVDGWEKAGGGLGGFCWSDVTESVSSPEAARKKKRRDGGRGDLCVCVSHTHLNTQRERHKVSASICGLFGGEL